MSDEIQGGAIYVPSDDVVSREIEGELILVPIAAGVGDLDDALFTLNETGKAIWKQLDGKRTVKDIAEELTKEYAADGGRIEADVFGLIAELVSRRILVRK